MHKLIHRHTVSFKYAFEGLHWAFTTQPNFIIHTVLSLVAVGLSIFFRITRIEFLIIIFTIIFGFAGELTNTALEAMTDLITTEWRKEAKIAKDVAAGTMLFIALGSIVVAFIIFTPYITKFLAQQ